MMKNKEQEPTGEKTSNFLLEKKVGKENEQIKSGINPKIFGLMIIGIMLIVIGMSFVSAVTNVTDCLTLSTAGTYYTLNTSISNDAITGDCMVVSAQNINQINLYTIKW